MAANNNDKVKILIDNIWVDQNVELKWDYYNDLMKIVKDNPNDLDKAISAAKAKYSTLNKSTSTWSWSWTKTITKRWKITISWKTYDLDTKAWQLQFSLDWHTLW